MKERCVIGIDLDGSLAEYQREIVKFKNDIYGADLLITDIKRDDCYDVLGRNILARAVKLRKFYNYTRALSFIKPMSGSQAVIQKLKNKGFKLVIVTSRFVGFSKATRRWLDKEYGRSVFEKVYFSKILASYSSKFKAKKYSELNPEFVIEDSPYVAMKCAKRGIKVLLLDSPWNKNFQFEGVTRVRDWDDVLAKATRLRKS